MHDAHDFLVNLALVLCVAGLTTVVFRRLKQPVVLGYLLAGAIVSPNTPFPLFADEGMIQALSELGVILLMYSLGLEFSFRKLASVGAAAMLVAAIECSLMMWLGYSVGQAFGWPPLVCFYVGAMVAISSTTIVVKAFAEHGVRGRLADIVYGELIVEDLIAILLITVLTTLSKGGGLSISEIVGTTGWLIGFLSIVVVGGLFVVPRLMRSIVRHERPETIVVTSIGLCFAFALLAQSAGYSVALGAFLAGALVAESGEGETIEHLVRPVRDVFAAIFFVAVGMLIDPRLVVEHWAAAIVLVLVVVGGKLVGVTIGVFLSGQGVRTSVQAGMSLAQIGEFSFIIAGVGVATGATEPFLYALAVAVSAATTLLTPWLIRASNPTANFIDRKLPHPVQTFASLYATWIEQLGKPREPSVGREIRHHARWLILNAAVIAGIVVAFAIAGQRGVLSLEAVAQLPTAVRWLLALAAAGVLVMPFCIGIVRGAAALAQLLAGVAFPAVRSGTDLANAPRGAFLVTLQLGILLAVAVPVVAVTQPFLPSLSGIVLLPAVVVLFAVAFWRSATNLQEHARAGAQAIVELLAMQMRAHAPVQQTSSDLAQIHQLLPGLGSPVPVRLGSGWKAVGRTLAQVNLRGLSGATVLAIVREGNEVVIPTGRETLREGDLLAIAGTVESIAAAQRLLETGKVE